MTAISGILLVDKPRRMTSHDVVDSIRKITGIRRIGHAGTLDPLAEGLLIILIGSATKRQEEFMAGEKEYIATIHLGATSDTDDAEGTIEEIPGLASQAPARPDIENALKNFTGEIEQTPPAYSAVKVSGQRAYQAARRGTPLSLTPRTVTIREVQIIEYTWPFLQLRVVCSPGTYIRAIARDLGKTLGCGAYLKALTRVRSGNFTLEQASPLADLTAENWYPRLLHSDRIPYTLFPRY